MTDSKVTVGSGGLVGKGVRVGSGVVVDLGVVGVGIAEAATICTDNSVPIGFHSLYSRMKDARQKIRKIVAVAMVTSPGTLLGCLSRLMAAPPATAFAISHEKTSPKSPPSRAICEQFPTALALAFIVPSVPPVQYSKG